MENEDFSSATAQPLANSTLTVSPLASGFLNEAGKWGKFLSIVGFCFIGIAVIGGLFASTIFSSLMGLSGAQSPLPFPGFLIGAIYIGFGLLYFFPVYYLFKFSTQISQAILFKNTGTMDAAFENLKSHYKFMGILMIVVLGLYVLSGGTMLLAAMLIH